MLILEPDSMCFDQFRCKFIEILQDMFNRRSKALNTVRNACFLLMRQYLINSVTYKQAGIHNGWNVVFAHPKQPLLLNLFINTKRYIIQ